MVDWNELFYYKDGKLFNKVTRGARAKKDEEAGNICKAYGYRVLQINGKNLRAHRIIWEMHNGKIPKGIEIDHINHDRLDNRLENLRLVTPSENRHNQTMRTDNTSGLTGVSWYKRRGKWLARLRVNGKGRHLGYFDDLEFAGLVITEAREKYGYHPNHGKH